MHDMAFENLQGTLEYNASIAPMTWFRVGGTADILYRPKDMDDLSVFLQQVPQEMPITILGAGSNIIIRDGGIRGIVIRLGRGFNEREIDDASQHHIKLGAAVPDMKAAEFLAEHGYAGGAFLRGIPGTIGGALKMNAGAYGREIKDIFIEAHGVDYHGQKHIMTAQDMQFQYRHSAPQKMIYCFGIFKFEKGDPEKIKQEMQEITNKRSTTQPVKSRTGGSTFKNPEGHKAWELIDAAGCRGLKIGDAQISELHCNFMLNLGNATANDIEILGETVREKVLQHSGVTLEWEIKRLGEKQ